MTINGGAGDDSIIILAGTNQGSPKNKGVTVSGGAGKNFIENTTPGGQDWGGVANSTYSDFKKLYYYLQAETVNGKQTEVEVDEPNDAADSDEFAWAPGVTIDDAKTNDILVYGGKPLVGGNSSGNLASQISILGLAGAAIGLAQDFVNPYHTIYFDEFLPGFYYEFKAQANGLYTLYIGNQNYDAQHKNAVSTTADPNPNVMTILNFTVAGSYFASQQASLAGLGTLGMVFKHSNPILDILAQLPDQNDPILMGIEASYGASPLVDEAETASAAVARYTTALKWSNGNNNSGDPLVLDLTGNGLVTTGMSDDNVYFNFNNNDFAVRTGWLGAGAGFLVLNNDHGIINSASQLFGNGGGFADLAAYDSNGDGIINADDAIWSQLAVWEDTNGDGVAEPGELFTLSQLGIASISLDDTIVNGTTAGGAQVNAFSTFNYTDGSAGAIYDVTFQTNGEDTQYIGQNGLASWQGPNLINLKGFGEVTSLQVAMANDFGFANLVTTTAAAMTTPDLNVLWAQVARTRPIWTQG